jgi:hypothetical protein
MEPTNQPLIAIPNSLTVEDCNRALLLSVERLSTLQRVLDSGTFTRALLAIAAVSQAVNNGNPAKEDALDFTWEAAEAAAGLR